MGASRNNPYEVGFLPIATFLLVIANIGLYGVLKHDYLFVYSEPSLTTLFGSFFSHGNLAHLFGNMLFLMLVGPKVEKNLGSYQFLSCYFLAGICSALGFGMFNPDARLLGASGAIFGIIALYPFVQKRLLGVLLSGLVVGFAFLQNFVASANSFCFPGSGVANLAHVAGGVSAILLFAFFKRKSV